MIRKVISMLLALCLLLSCLPLAVTAEGEEESAPAVSEPAEASAGTPESPAAPAAAAPEESSQATTEITAAEPAKEPTEESAEKAEAPEASEPAEPASTEMPIEPSPTEVPATPKPAEPTPTELPIEPSPTAVPAEPEPTATPLPEEEWDATLLAYTILTPSNFPDPAFRYALYAQFGALSSYEASLVTVLDVSNAHIEDLTGIRFFPNLEVLDCSGNEIEYLSLPSLRYLSALDCSDNDLEYLSVSSCKRLITIDASNNLLDTVDVSNLGRLETLDVTLNPLQVLKINDCDALDTLLFPAGSLTSLQAAGCISLTALDVSTAAQLQSLDVRDCIGICALSLSSAKLSTLRVSGCLSLAALDCHGTSVKSLDVTGCTALTKLDCSFCQLTSLSVRSCAKLESIDCRGNMLSSLTLQYFGSLETLRAEGNALTKLDLTGCMNLTYLSCGDNRLSSLILTDCFSLETLLCEDNRLTALSLSALSALKVLKCEGNELTALAVESCPNLTELSCGNNRLLHLDQAIVSSLTAVSLGTQHPAAALTAYMPAEEAPAYAFACLSEILPTGDASIVSHDLPELGGDKLFPVIDTETEKILLTFTYPNAVMQAEVTVDYTFASPFTCEQSYLLLDDGETFPGLSSLFKANAFTGSSAYKIDWAAYNTEETHPSDVISVSGDTLQAEKSGTAVLYGKPCLTYDSDAYAFAPIRLRVDVAESASASADIIGISVPVNTAQVELFSTSYTRLELLLEREALKDLTASGRIIAEEELEQVQENKHQIASAAFVDSRADGIFELKVLDDRTLAVVPRYDAMQAAWYTPKLVGTTYRSEILVTLVNGDMFYTNRVTLTVKQNKPSLSAYSLSIDTLDIFSAGAQTSFPISFKSSAQVLSLEPNTNYRQPLPAWLSLDGEGRELIYAGDEEYKGSGYAYLLATLQGWAIKVPVSVKVSAVCSLSMRFEKKHLSLRADGADSDLVCFTTKPLSVRGIDFFRDNAALTVAKEKGKSYSAADLFTMTEYYNAGTGYYGWYLQVKPGSAADDGRQHSYTVSLVVAERTVYFYVKVIPYSVKPSLKMKNGGSVDMSVLGSSTSCKLTLNNMNLLAEDGAGNYLVVPTFRVTLGSPYGTDITSLFTIDLIRAAGVVYLTLDSYMPLGKTYSAYLWAEVDNGGYANAAGYARFTVKESAKSIVKPSFTFRRLGTIDTARGESFVMLAPTVKNFPQYNLSDCAFTFYEKKGGIWQEMTDWYDYFDLTEDTDADCFYLSAADPASHPLTPGNSYAFSAVWLFDGVPYFYGTAAKPIVIPVRQNKAAFSVSAPSTVFSRLDGSAEVLLTFTAKDLSLNAIDSVELDSASEKYFTISKTETGAFRLGWAEDAPRRKLKAGTYRTVTLNIFLEGNITSKPNATLKLKIKLS